MSDETNELIAAAIAAAGSQRKLAELSVISQQHVSRLLHLKVSVTAETAVAIDRATKGVVSKSKLRPDLWPPPETGESTPIHKVDQLDYSTA